MPATAVAKASGVARAIDSQCSLPPGAILPAAMAASTAATAAVS
jgi:hypothetical protein